MKASRLQFLSSAIPFLAAGALSGLPVTAQDAAGPVDFMRDVKPLLEGACIQCHGPDETHLEGDYRMDTREAAFAGGSSYKDEVIIPGDANRSPVYWMTNLHEDDPKSDECMPPQKPLNKDQQQVLHDWIQNGAEWPDGVVLEQKKRVNFANVRQLLIKGGPFTAEDKMVLRYWVEQGADWPEGASLGIDAGPADNLELVKKIAALITEKSTVTTESGMVDYESEIPKTGVKYQMVALPGGEFLMGSPDSEKDHLDDEGPQHRVSVDPFWIGKFEVSWQMFDGWAKPKIARYKDGTAISMPPDADLADAVSAPTSAFMPMDFGMGVKGYPAICMTQHAALKFCQWLSAQTGHYYRLPTEAEWEYACRAGSSTAYFHGDGEEGLAEFGVFDPTQVRNGYEKSGLLKPNAFGLHDMHGNVMEWVLDQYTEDAYAKRSADGVTHMPFEKPTKLYPRVVRGGSWYDAGYDLRSSRRIFSDPNWKIQDPQLPKSIWYHTDADWLGFRIVRPLKTPTAEEMHEIWNLGLADE